MEEEEATVDGEEKSETGTAVGMNDAANGEEETEEEDKVKAEAEEEEGANKEDEDDEDDEEDEEDEDDEFDEGAPVFDECVV